MSQSKDSNEFVEKPPLGVIPEWLHKEKRKREIDEAIQRYLDANMAIPVSWIAETYAIASWLENRKEEKELEESKKPKPEWEIVSIMSNHLTNTPLFAKEGIDAWLDGFEKDSWHIHSVKRLLDGEIFSVGDYVEWDYNKLPGRYGEPSYKIESFQINTMIEPNRMFVNNKNICIDYLSHIPKTTRYVPPTNETKMNIEVECPPQVVIINGIEYRPNKK